MADEQQVLLTAEGKRKLEEELEYLKTTRRQENKARLQQAIDFGDISENSEYDDAKNEQAFIEGRIIELENTLPRVKIITESKGKKSKKKVTMGSIVTIEDIELGEQMTYSLVGSIEANPLKQKISNESPVGSAILGASAGQEVTVHAPAGNIIYRIIDIK